MKPNLPKLMQALRDKKFAPPNPNDGWFCTAQMATETGTSERTVRDLMSESVKAGALEMKEFVVWDDKLARTARRVYYREKTAKA